MPDAVMRCSGTVECSTENYLAETTRRVGLGELDFQSGLDLSTLTKNWIDSRRAGQELQLKLDASNATGDQIIRIEGGMPALLVAARCLTILGTRPLSGFSGNSHMRTIPLRHR